MINNKVKFGVGVLILILFLNIGIVFYYVLNEKGIFDKRYDYHFITYSADPFAMGMPIKVSGFKIGYINNIKLNDNGSVEISFSIDEQNQKWITKESIIMIRKPLLGPAEIILYPAIDNEVLREGSKLKVYESNDINEVIYKLAPIMEKIENIVNSVDKITSYLARDNSELVNIVKNLESFSTKLIENPSVLTTITGDKKATDSLIMTINKLPLMVENINKLSSNLNTDIAPEVLNFIKELRGIAQDVKLKLERLNGVVDSVGSSKDDIIKIKEDINTAISRSNKILEKVDTLLPADNSNKVQLP